MAENHVVNLQAGISGFRFSAGVYSADRFRAGQAGGGGGETEVIWTCGDASSRGVGWLAFRNRLLVINRIQPEHVILRKFSDPY
jgi:hypothetical protein